MGCRGRRGGGEGLGEEVYMCFGWRGKGRGEERGRERREGKSTDAERVNWRGKGGLKGKKGKSNEKGKGEKKN